MLRERWQVQSEAEAAPKSHEELRLIRESVLRQVSLYELVLEVWFSLGWESM